MAKLIVVGNTCTDIYVPAHQAPQPGGIQIIPPLDMQIGGNGANTAITAARLGTSTAVAGVLGDDAFGRILRRELKAEGVDVARLKMLPGRASPTSIVYNDGRGERSFAHHPGTNADYSLPAEAMRAPCRVFHLAAPELLSGLWPGGWVEAARKLKAAGRIISLDSFVVADRRNGSDRIIRDHHALLQFVDLAFPNEAEAQLISGQREPRAIADYFHDLGVEVVAIKRGPKGAVVSWQGRMEEVPAASVKVVDTCGAGDNFTGGFLAGYLRGLNPLNCARVGCALGTLCVRFRGSLTGTANSARLKKVLPGFDLGR